VELEELLERKGVIITSKRCKTPALSKICELAKKDMILVFGNPEEGVFEISERLGIKIKAECWNTVPEQGVETVRLEEAILASLAILNFVRHVGKGGLK
jgi:hypothetical protein